MIGCGDLDEFKEKHLRTALKWIEDAETRQLDWLVVISEGQRGRGRSVFEKMKSEAGSKREDQVKDIFPSSVLFFTDKKGVGVAVGSWNACVADAAAQSSGYRTHASIARVSRAYSWPGNSSRNRGEP
jgi:hypothetical protein